MLEAHEIATPDGLTVVFGPLPPSRHGACVTRILQPAFFHGEVTFLATFLDAMVRQRGVRGGTFEFKAPRRRACACAFQLFMARNELMARLRLSDLPSHIEASIDGVSCRINLLGYLGGAEPEWFKIDLVADDESIIDGLLVFGLEAVDDFMSGWLPSFAEGTP
jgi:hypothetical protein